MTHRTFDEQIANFNRVVSSWDINQEYKVALLGMIASLGYEHEKSITPEPHWIPVTERMPEEHEWLGTKRFGTTKSDEVYVTFENQKGERFCKHIRFQNGKLSSADQHTIDTIYKGSKPIAWMPLPEAYHEEVTE